MTSEKMTRGAGPLPLAPGEFFGGARLGRSGGGIEVSHRIAACAPEEVLAHTHHDAHFILVTGGDYVSAAGRAVEVGTLSLDALCMELLGSMDARRRALPVAPPRWLGSAVELLHDRYRDELTIAEIAAVVGVHPIHLARTFRRHLRCTPGEFARFRRFERAASLLARTARPLAEVALDSGFANQSHFSRVFARSFGVPPGEYRALAR